MLRDKNSGLFDHPTSYVVNIYNNGHMAQPLPEPVIKLLSYTALSIQLSLVQQRTRGPVVQDARSKPDRGSPNLSCSGCDRRLIV